MNNATTSVVPLLASGDWIDPLEQAFRSGVRIFLQEILELEITEALGRLRHRR